MSVAVRKLISPLDMKGARILTKRKNFLVLSLPSKWPHLHSVPRQFECAWLNQETISTLFPPEEKHHVPFEQFIVGGFTGVVWHNGHEWASYAWMSLPRTFGPPHLPRSIRKLPVNWIFYCRTKEEYQGQGLFKASLSVLGQRARKRDPASEVYIDTEPNNILSRVAIRAMGFAPKGIMTTCSIRIPRHSLVVWGRWDMNAPHPELAGEVEWQ